MPYKRLRPIAFCFRIVAAPPIGRGERRHCAPYSPGSARKTRLYGSNCCAGGWMNERPRRRLCSGEGTGGRLASGGDVC